jgi:NADH-quinone oxidoreductase subunit M
VLLRDATTHELVVWSPVVVLVVAFGLWPGWLLEATDPVVRRLLGSS